MRPEIQRAPEDYRWDMEMPEGSGAAPNNNPVQVAGVMPSQREIYGFDGTGESIESLGDRANGRSRNYGTYNVQRGDSWSKIVGSNPADIGLAMLLNDRRNSNVYAGETVVTGSLTDYSDTEIEQFKQLGLATLKQDNERIAQLAEARVAAELNGMNQREANRFAALASTQANTAAGAISASMQTDPRLMQGLYGFAAAQQSENLRLSGGFEPAGGWPTPNDMVEGAMAQRMADLVAEGKARPEMAAAVAGGILISGSGAGREVAFPSRASIAAEARAARATSGMRDAELTVSFGAEPIAGETSATAAGKSVHRTLAAERRASGDFDLVNQPIRDSQGNVIEVPRRVDLTTGAPRPGAGTQSASPDAVRGPVIIDDKPFGRPITKDRQEIIRFIDAYEQSRGQLPSTIAIQRYDPTTLRPVVTELYKPSDFLPPKKR